MLTKDDEDWVALLEGKEVPDADPNTVDEVRALKIALHTELQWQKLQARIQAADEARNTEPNGMFHKLYKRFKKASVFKKSIWEPIYRWLNWKPLTLGTAYTLVVVMATVSFIAPVQVEKLLSKSSSPVQSNNCSSGYLLRIGPEPKEEALSMERQLEYEEVSYKEINDKTFFLKISPSNPPSQKLRDFWDEKSIETALLPDCPVSFIFTVFEKE
jgi:hypothetical protein